MKLSAVTICVHESDSLACTLANRDQFDRWLIVTVPKDRDTIALCRQYGLDCHIVHAMGPDGEDALAQASRARATAEGLDALGAESWVATISSYILLPRSFRAQLAAMKLAQECGYRMGYRSCANRRKAERLKWCEPWRADAASPADSDNHFQLIHPGFGDAAVGRQRRPVLPMVALLFGEGALLWGAGIRADEQLPDADHRPAALRDVLARAGGGQRVLLAGHHPSVKLSAWAPLCAQVFATDDFGLRAQARDDLARDDLARDDLARDDLADAAQAALRALWLAEVAGLDNLVELDSEAAARIPDRSLDALYLPGEATVQRLLAGMPFWRRTLKDGALLCGDLYGRPDWPEASLAIAQLFGTPEGVCRSGFWHGRFDPARLPVCADAGRAPAITIVNPPGGDPERLLTSMMALRSHWSGPVIVKHAQPTDPVLMAACARLGATLSPAKDGMPASERDGPGLVLAAGTLALRPMTGLLDRAAARPTFAALRESAQRLSEAVARRLGRTGARPAPPARLIRARGWVSKIRVADASKLADLPPESQPPLVWYKDGSGGESPAARRLWSGVAGAMRATLTPPIRVAADSTIIAIVRPEVLSSFERNWPTWNFGGAVPVLVACAGLAPSDIAWLAPPPPRIVQLAQSETADPGRLLGALMERVATRRVILLPECAHAEPGAELFAAGSWSMEPVVFHSAAEVRRVNDAVPKPWRREPLLVSIATDYARRLPTPDPAPDPAPEGGFKRWLEAAVSLAGGWSICNVESWGWQLR